MVLRGKRPRRSCYGPVRFLPQAEGGLQRVATFCQGDKNMVPLKD